MTLAPFGEWSHRLGLQIVDTEAAEAMAADLARRWRAAPIFLGHPDDATIQAPVRFRGSLGRVVSLRVRQGFLEAAVRWRRLGRALVEAGAVRFLSPRWEMTPLEASGFRPVRLISVGLTNTPNLPVPPLRADRGRVDPALLHALGFRKTPLELLPACRELAADARRWREDGRTLRTERDEARARARDAETRRLAEQGRAEDAEHRWQRERKARLDAAIELAARSGTVLPGERETLATELQVEPEAAFERLRHRRPVLKTSPVAERLHPGYDAPDDLAALAQREAKASGRSFTEAWSQLKTARPELFLSASA